MTERDRARRWSDGIARAAVDERRDEAGRARRSSRAMRNKIGYPDAWRDYATLEVARDDFAGNVERAAALRDAAPAREDRQAGRPRRVGHDAADGERVLRPADERHELPGRRPAAAALRPEDRRRAELRQHRRHHRARAHPRLRRRGPPVRREGQPARLVDAGGRERVRGARELRRRTSTRSTWWSTTSRSTASSRSARTSPTSAAPILAYDAWKDATASEALAAEGRAHADAALLRRLRAVGVRERARRSACACRDTNPHSPGRWRVNGVVANMPEFARGVPVQGGPADGARGRRAASGEGDGRARAARRRR